MERWDDVRLFLAVAQSGTLSAAAEQLEQSVSTLHRRLARLETHLGSRLFQRGPRGYQLTAAGSALLPHAIDLQDRMQAAARSVMGHDQEAEGEVRITLPLVLVEEVTRHLVAFTAAHPSVQPILQADDIVLDLDRETDIALRATSQPKDAAVGRNLCGMAWAVYGPSEGEPQGWVHYRGLDQTPAVQWRKQAFPAVNPRLDVYGCWA